MERKRHSKGLQNEHFKKLNNSFGSIPNCLELSQGQVRGIKTKCNINKGKTILEVPYKFILNAKTTSNKYSPFLSYVKLLYYISKECVISQASRKAIRSIKRVIKICNKSFCNFIYLIEQKYLHFQHPDKLVQEIHQAYISLLPKDYNYHPLSHFKIFQPYQQHIYKELADRWAFLETFQKKINELIILSFDGRSFKNFLRYKNMQNLYQQYRLMFSFDNILWGALVLQTRRFSKSQLVPLLDMFNHSPQQNAKWYFNNKTNKVKLISKRSIQSGEEILVNYGKTWSQQDLLIYHGFYEPDKQKSKGVKRLSFELPEFDSEEDQQEYIKVNDLQPFIDSREYRDMILQKLQRQINENKQLNENQLKLLQMLRRILKEHQDFCDDFYMWTIMWEKQMKSNKWK